MENKVIYCGECEKFLYEDTDGFGVCGKTNEECYCGDKCHLTHGKPRQENLMTHSIARNVSILSARYGMAKDIARNLIGFSTNGVFVLLNTECHDTL